MYMHCRIIFVSKRVFITGGTGFLGCHLARYFLKEGYSVTLYDSALLTASDLHNKVSCIQGDVCDYKKVFLSMKNHSFVIHAAAGLPILRKKNIIYDTNINGTENVLKAAHRLGVKRVVFISSTAVYGIPQELPETEDSPINPIGYYGESKILAEKCCNAYYKKGLSINILRPKSFLGPERLGVFSLWFEAIYSNKKVFLLGDGNNVFQLLAVSDVVVAIEKALRSKVDGEIFNIGAKEFGTWREDLDYVIKRVHSKAKIFSLPVIPSQIFLTILERLNLSPISAWHYKTMPVASYVSIKKAKQLLHWSPQKSNKQLLFESYQWYKKNRRNLLHTIGKTHRVSWNFKFLQPVTKI